MLAGGPRPQRFRQRLSPRLTQRLSQKKKTPKKKGPGAFVNDYHLASANGQHKKRDMKEGKKIRPRASTLECQRLTQKKFSKASGLPD
jgi:hypothetical protein